MSVQNHALLLCLTRWKPDSGAHMLIANWTVPEGDEANLTYLGGFKGFDPGTLQYAHIHEEWICCHRGSWPAFCTMQ
jgi:hypothetical protein